MTGIRALDDELMNRIFEARSLGKGIIDRLRRTNIEEIKSTTEARGLSGKKREAKVIKNYRRRYRKVHPQKGKGGQKVPSLECYR